VTFSKGSNVSGDIMLGAGDDTFTGWNSDELIYGGIGKDKLTGGRGEDTFFFVTVEDTGSTKASADTITDFRFKEGDIIDLSGIDAKDGVNNDQAFKFIGNQAFHDKAGELRFEIKGKETYIYGDTDGDGNADFAIHLDGKINLKVDHFDL
jgi:Ca2+-binding RTX toxin-like protein